MSEEQKKESTTVLLIKTLFYLGMAAAGIYFILAWIFLEEVEPYRVYIDMYLDKGAMPNLKIREELNDLDYRLRIQERLVIYGKTNIELFPTDMACASCVKSMMFNLRRWIKIKESEINEETVEFKGVPPIVDLTKLKWGELRKYATSKGLNVKGKTRAQLTEELTSL